MANMHSAEVHGDEMSAKLNCLDLASRVNNGQGGDRLLEEAKKLYEWVYPDRPPVKLRAI